MFFADITARELLFESQVAQQTACIAACELQIGLERELGAPKQQRSYLQCNVAWVERRTKGVVNTWLCLITVRTVVTLGHAFP